MDPPDIWTDPEEILYSKTDEQVLELVKREKDMDRYITTAQYTVSFLHFTILYDFLETFKYIYRHYKASILKQDYFKRSGFHLAAQYSRNIYSFILAEGERDFLRSRDARGWNILNGMVVATAESEPESESESESEPKISINLEWFVDTTIAHIGVESFKELFLNTEQDISDFIDGLSWYSNEQMDTAIIKRLFGMFSSQELSNGTIYYDSQPIINIVKTEKYQLLTMLLEKWTDIDIECIKDTIMIAIDIADKTPEDVQLHVPLIKKFL